MVRRLWEDEYAECWVQVAWLYFPEETPSGRLPSHLPGEVFVSEHLDSNTLDAVAGAVTLLPLQDWERRRAEASAAAGGQSFPPKDVFVCRARYDVRTRLFRPLPSGQPLPLAGPSVAQPVAPATPPRPGAASAASTPPTVPRVSSSSSSAASPSICPPAAAESPHAAACRRLQLAAVPARLPCRDDERDRVRSFLEAGVRAGSARSSLYLSGMPGTGKTATVREVLRSLEQESDGGSLPRFEQVWVNALTLSHPHQLYPAVWRALTNRNAGPSRAAQLLDARFSSPSARRRVVVLVVDELDCLVTRKQTVLYNLLDWPSRRHARLVVVGIANTMDLPERMLPRVHSRLGLARVVFAPYSRDQIRSIVCDRLHGLGVFRSDAVEMASRKVAALSGDVRRALHLCRRAAEIAAARLESEDDGAARAAGGADVPDAGLVRIADVQAAAKELSATRHLAALRSAGLWERALVAAVFVHLRAGATLTAGLPAVHRRLCTLLRAHIGSSGSKLPSLAEADEMVERLGDARLLLLDRPRGARWPTVRLGVQADDVPFALREDSLLSKMLD